MDQLSPEMIQLIITEFGNQFVSAAKKNRLDSFRRLNPIAKKKGIAFIGDSITEGFPIYEMYHGEIPVYNRGVGGDTTYELLQKLPQTVYELEPSIVVMLIGTNDLAFSSDVSGISGRIEQICQAIIATQPNVRLIVQSVYPINPSDDPRVIQYLLGSRTNALILELNERIQEMTTRLEIDYVDLHPALKDEHGNLKLEYTTDGLHLNVEGYEAVLQVLQKHLN
jgi:lysophospholipase L1-like esterase